jgi:hypothetical protein
MLDESEWELVAPLLQCVISDVKRISREQDVSIAEARGRVSAVVKYRELTGFPETNVTAIWHHRASLYGPPCRQCGKPLRTPDARACAECGAAAT